MASVPIGGVRVDLTLNSAAFIKDIAKTNTAIAASTKQMTSQLTRLQQVSQNVGRTFGAWITLRATRQVINFLDRSIELAAKLDNQLGQTAKAFETQGAAMRNAFQLGAAQGFLNVFTGGTQNATERLQQMAKAGAIIGTVLGAVGTVAVDIFTIVIPKAIEAAIFGINKLVEGANATIAALEKIDNLLGLQKDYGRIPLIPVTDIEAGAAAFFGLDQAARLAADATNLAAESQKKMGESVRDTSDKIIKQLNDMDALRQKHFETQLKLTQGWLNVADTVGQALGLMFKENKAVAIAQAVVNTAQAITEAMKLPIPLNFAMMAAVAALGAAQIATIASAQPGSSKALTKPSTGSASAATAKAGAASKGQFSPGQTVTINVQGDVFGPEHFRKIVEGINGVQRDGTALIRVAA